MATKLPAAFRLKRNVVELIERLATDTSTNKVDVVERSVELLDAQLNDAGRRAHVDLAELRRRYGKARMVIGVAMKDGEPVAGLTIDGKAPKDVHARAYADLDGGEVHVLLELGGREGEHPRLAKIGDEPLFQKSVSSAFAEGAAKLNIPFKEPAILSKELSPIRPRLQLSSMKRSMEDWSLTLWST